MNLGWGVGFFIYLDDSWTKAHLFQQTAQPLLASAEAETGSEERDESRFVPGSFTFSLVRCDFAFFDASSVVQRSF